MTEYENVDGSALSEKQRTYLKTLMKVLEDIVETCQEPLDSKVLGLLEITCDIIDQQLKLDIYHEWDSQMESGKGEIEDINPPSAEDLKRWFGHE